MTYIQQILEELRENLPSPCHEDLLPYYALLVLVKGVNTSPADVHDAWSAWARPDHPRLVPFSGLSEQDQEKDVPFAAVIRDIALRVTSW